MFFPSQHNTARDFLHFLTGPSFVMHIYVNFIQLLFLFQVNFIVLFKATDIISVKINFKAVVELKQDPV